MTIYTKTGDNGYTSLADGTRVSKADVRIATYKINDKTAQRLECHNESLESFEPLDGLGLLLVAMHDKPEAIQAFILDTPVCLHKGVWHQLLAITDDVTVKIMENLEVSSDFFILEPPLTLALT